MITEKKTQFLLDELEQLRQQGLFRPLRVLGSAQDTEVVVDGKHVLNLSSNNYLGLTTHPRLKQAMIEATEQWGAGSGAVRTIAGTVTVHEDLERRLAEPKHTEPSLVFQSGFTANLGVLQPLARERHVNTSAVLNPASKRHASRLARSCSARPMHRGWRPPASRRSTSSTPSRSASSGCGRTRLASRTVSNGSASKPAPARRRSRRSSWARARWPWSSLTASSRSASLPRESAFRRSPRGARGSAPS